jgi:hypothetical protein
MDNLMASLVYPFRILLPTFEVIEKNQTVDYLP